MYRVFWMEDDEPRSAGFAAGELSGALAFAEEQRRRRRGGAPVSFVVLASEDPDSVGESGVADAADGYDWVKRRPRPGLRRG